MSKVRVHELAKELDSNSKEIIGLMAGFGFPTRNHMSALEQEELDVLFERLTQAYDKKFLFLNLQRKWNHQSLLKRKRRNRHKGRQQKAPMMCLL